MQIVHESWDFLMPKLKQECQLRLAWKNERMHADWHFNQETENDCRQETENEIGDRIQKSLCMHARGYALWMLCYISNMNLNMNLKTAPRSWKWEL